MSPYMKKMRGKSEEEEHYELFVDCRPKDSPDAAIQQMAFRDIYEIQPDVKQIELGVGKRHKLVTHFESGENYWYTLLSDGLQYQSLNPEVATVDDHGVVTAKKKGSAIIIMYLENIM